MTSIMSLTAAGAVLASSVARAEATLERCLGVSEAHLLKTELREIIAMETTTTLGLNPTQPEIHAAYARIQARPWTFSTLKCMGFKPTSAKDVEHARLQPALNIFIAAMARLNERLWPKNIAADRPESIQSGVIKRVHFRSDVTVFEFGSWQMRANGYVQRPLRFMSLWVDALAHRPDGGLVTIPEDSEHGTPRFSSGFSPRPFFHCMSSWSAKGGTSTSLHEYGHVLDFAAATPMRSLFQTHSKHSPHWTRARESEPMISPYGETSPTEDFAESFTAYFLDPLFACYAPEKHAFVSRHAQANAELYGHETPYATTVDCSSPRVRALLKARAEWVARAKTSCKRS